MGYEPPRSYHARPASGDLETLIDRTIADYASHNGVQLRVAFGVWVPKEGWDVGCLCEPDLPEHEAAWKSRRAIIVTPCTPNEPWEKGRSYLSAGMRERAVSSRTDVLDACRSAVVDALRPRVDWERRSAAIRLAGGDVAAPPLWSLDVHPLVPALVPDFAARLALDAAAVARPATDGRPQVRPTVPTSDSFRVDGRRLVVSDLRVQPDLWIEHWGDMFYLHIPDRLPETMLRALQGSPVRQLLGSDLGEAGDLAIESAIHDAAGTRFTITQLWTAAETRPGDEAWRTRAQTPPEWRTSPNGLPLRETSS